LTTQGKTKGHHSAAIQIPLTDKAFDVFQRLVPEIGVVQFGVVAALGHQVIVGAFFDDPTVIHDDDAVGILDGGQAVGDDDGRLVSITTWA